jgi:competence protein ComEC
MKVSNVIVGKQFKDSENFQKLVEISNDKKIKITVLEAGNRLDIEKDIYINILWPSTSEKISDNILNNNSLVCKLVYKNFSCLFTGDIEEIAEKSILKKYENNLKILKSDIIKVAHHGSKTSSTEEFLETVSPKIALVGVGKNNKFGHPNDDVIERLKSLNCKVYRTDECGEVKIVINRSGNIKCKKYL